MKKINDTELIQMIESGKSQKECAEHFGTSPSAINQRLKKLDSFNLPESFNNLTKSRKSFVLAKLEGKNNAEAAKESYNVTSNDSAKNIGSRLMKEPEVNIAMRDIMAQEGIPKRRRVQRLRDLIEAPDLGIVAKGLDMASKLTGDYAPQQVDILLSDEMIVHWIDTMISTNQVIDISQSETDKESE
jgi:DNA-binding MarR family transcriptional regulator